MTIEDMKANIRAAIVKEAAEWLMTPYHHMGRVKGQSVDCACLLAEVAERAKIAPHISIEHYPQDWHLHRGEEIFLGIVRKWAYEITRDALLPGDIIMFRYGRAYSHGGIMTGSTQIIHAVYGEFVQYGDIQTDQRLKNADQLYFRSKVL